MRTLVATVALTAVAVASPTTQEPETWAFEPPVDTFSDDALLDLRSLNEDVAGQHGFVRLSEDGASFVRGDGEAIRFWAVNTGAYRAHPKRGAPDLERHARFLAKRGVNMVRFHGNVTVAGDDPDAIDEGERDALWRTVAAMREQGIYVTFSPYWAVSSRVTPGADGLLMGGKAKHHGGLFFDPRLQRAYRSWWRQVLVPENPYTGIPLKDDPALAILQFQNEDSLLFWTVGAIEGEAARALRRRFFAFAVGRYGSADAARRAWDGARVDGDDPAREELGLFHVWELTRAGNVTRRGSEGQRARAADQTEFLTELMVRFHEETVQFLEEELGCRALVNAGNWKTADDARLLDAERYAQSVTDVVALNRYVTGLHLGEHVGWAIVAGDRFTDESLLRRPRAFPLNVRQVAGRPTMITESTWVPPLSRQAEGPFLVAAYGALTGLDAFYWFATGEEDWRQPGSANGYLPSLGKWVCATPMLMGQWPAAALVFRQGLVAEGTPVVDERRTLGALWRREVPAIVEQPGYDPNRDAGDGSREGPRGGRVDPLAFLAGPVRVSLGAERDGVEVADLDECIRGDGAVVRSNTEELSWDRASGVVQLIAPRAQGACGFLGALGEFELGAVAIDCRNEYASVLLVSLDERPLSRSRRVLVQVGTSCRPTGWKTKPVTIEPKQGPPREGEEVVAFGSAPWQVVAADLRVTIRNRGLTSARVLDSNFEAVARIPLEREGGRAGFRFPREGLYVVLTAD